MYCIYCGKQIQTNSNFCCYCGKEQSFSLIEYYKTKEVIVVDIDNKLLKVKQFCQCILEDNLVLLSGTSYDNSNKIYHKYLDCYEDWNIQLKNEFKNWKIECIENLNDYTECKRCFERTYRKKHPNYKITGYNWNYYYEDI